MRNVLMLAVSLLFLNFYVITSHAQTPKVVDSGTSIISEAPATPAAVLQAAALAAEKAALDAAQKSVVSAVSPNGSLPMSSGLVVQLLAIYSSFNLLLSGLQKLFKNLATPTAAPGAAVPAPSVWQKFAGLVLVVVKAVGSNL